MSSPTGEARLAVARLAEPSAEDAVSVLVDAFAGYPIMTFVLGPGPDLGRLETLVRLFVRARLARREPLLGVLQGGELAAVALASFPGGPPAPLSLKELRAEVWRRLGPEAERRYDAYGAAAAAALAIDRPHVHLNMVGVRNGSQRLGCGRLLIDAVQEIARAQEGSAGVTLTTEDPANVPYYQRLGFEVVGQRTIAPGLETWGFFRANDPRPTGASG